MSASQRGGGLGRPARGEGAARSPGAEVTRIPAAGAVWGVPGLALYLPLGSSPDQTGESLSRVSVWRDGVENCPEGKKGEGIYCRDLPYSAKQPKVGQWPAARDQAPCKPSLPRPLQVLLNDTFVSERTRQPRRGTRTRSGPREVQSLRKESCRR